MSAHDSAAVEPILAAKRTIEAAIEAHLQKISALRKRADALNTAIQVLRSSDEELNDLMSDPLKPLPIRYSSRSQLPVRVIHFDEAVVEKAVVDLLTVERWITFNAIVDHLASLRLQFSKAGLRRILKTSPAIDITGVRDSTRYGVKSLVENNRNLSAKTT